MISIEDKRFVNTFEKVYGKLSTRQNIKNLDFWNVQGNHDHRGNATAQITYSHVKDTTWKLPDLWYSFEIRKSENLTMTIIMIDTMIMQSKLRNQNIF